MKILIVSGIFKPELGGPATFAVEIGNRLTSEGHEVTLVTYSSVKPTEQFSFPVVYVSRHRNKLSNYCRYFWRVWRLTSTSRPDLVYCLDWLSAGLPATAVCRIRSLPYIVRVGAGYIWEKYLAEGHPPLSLEAFYTEGIYRRYPLLYTLISWVLRNAKVVIFNSNNQRVLFEKYYHLPSIRTQTIYNIAPELNPGQPVVLAKRRHEIVFAGRLIVMKNVATLIRAFAKVNDPTFTLSIIGEGPEEGSLRRLVSELNLSQRIRFSPALSQSELYRQINDAYLVVIPSWTDISPHQVYECLALGIPFLLTKEHYLPITFDREVLVDPRSVDDIAEKINRLLVPSVYRAFTEQFKKVSCHWTWQEVMVAHEQVFDRIR